MSRTQTLLLISGLCVVGGVGGMGCTKSPPPPNQESLIYALGTLRFGGAGGRLWPEGQAYYEAIRGAYQQWRAEVQLLAAQAVPEALWPKDDPRWQDPEARQVEIRRLDPHVADTGERRQARDKALEALEAAVANVPAGLGLTDGPRKAEFVGRVWHALANRREATRTEVAALEALVRDRQRLYRPAHATAAPADTQPEDEQAATAPTAAAPSFDEAYEELRQALRQHRDASLIEAGRRLERVEAMLRQTDKREEPQEFLLLTSERNYLRSRLEAIPAGLRRELIRLETELKHLEQQYASATADKKAELTRRIAATRDWAAALRQERDELEARIAEIFARIKTRLEQLPPPGNE